MDVKNAVISLKNKLRFDKGFKIWLFQAFKERNDVAFYRAAESIIADELAANHHTRLGWANKYVKENLSIPRKSETQHPTPKSLWIFLLGFLGSTQPTIINTWNSKVST